MKKRIYLTTLLALFTAFTINTIEAQSEKAEKVEKAEKKVIVKKKTVDKDGNETTTVEEFIGDAADKYIEEMESEEETIKVVVETEAEAEGEEIEIEVEIQSDSDDGNENTWVEKKKYKIKVLDDSGNENVIIWNSDDEMPEDMKNLMEEHDIDFTVKGKSNKKIIMIDTDNNVIKEEKQSFKMKFVDEDGNVQLYEWDGTGEMPEKMKKLMEAHEMESIELHGDGEHDVIRIVEDGNQNKAQLGVMIENAEGGVMITGFIEGSNAAKAGLQKGDVISMFEGEQISDMDALIEAIGKKEAGDTIEIAYIRGDLERNIEVELTARKQAAARKFKWKEADKTKNKRQ